MKDFLSRISSRKFLTTAFVEIAAIVALFKPSIASEANEGAVRLAAIIAMVLAALGYGIVQGTIDKNK